LYVYLHPSAPAEIYTLSLHDALPISEFSLGVRCCVPSNSKKSGNIELTISLFSSISPFSQRLSMFVTILRQKLPYFATVQWFKTANTVKIWHKEHGTGF